MQNQEDERLAQEILAEFRAVSEKSHQSRFQHDFETVPRPDPSNNSQSFLDLNPEKASLNQYWYSNATIEVLCKAIIEKIQDGGGKVAFLSTPSLYFAMPIELRANCFIFDIDNSLSYDPNFVYFDFNKPNDIPSTLIGIFDMVVIDPPFISAEVWEQYAITVGHLIRKNTNNGLILTTTIAENEELMFQLFQAKRTIFLPCIPNLVYQYKTYCNFPSQVLSAINTELP